MELLLFASISSIIIGALVLLMGRSFSIPREQLEQGALTANAKKSLERISDEIRNAQYIDCNQDGDTADDGEHWLVAADEYSLTFYGNVDKDPEAEKIKYFIENDNPSEKKKLKRSVFNNTGTACDFPATGDTAVILKGANNVKGPSNSTPLFQYFINDEDSCQIGSPVDSTLKVMRVRMNLLITNNESEEKKVTVETDIVPRTVVKPPACQEKDLLHERHVPGSNFADSAFENCKTYCTQDANLAIGECCPYSVSFSGMQYSTSAALPYVYSSCECKEAYFPAGLVPESVNLNGYTDFVQRCLDGTTCQGQKGNPICDPGCLDSSGECVCECPFNEDNEITVITNCFGEDNDNDGFLDICTCNDLQRIGGYLDKNYELLNDIDCSETSAWNGGEGFIPLGNCEPDSCSGHSYSGTYFTGEFNGNEHIIEDLFMNRISTVKGLFGASQGKIMNVGMSNIQLYGGAVEDGSRGYGGGLVAINEGSIENSYAISNIDISSNEASCFTGGLVGYNRGTIEKSYSKSTVTGSHNNSSFTHYSGGLAGINFSNIKNSFSVSEVNSESSTFTTTIGGLVGRNYVLSPLWNPDADDAIIENSYAVLLNSENVSYENFGGLAGSFVYLSTSFSNVIKNSFGITDIKNTLGVGKQGGIYGDDYEPEDEINNSYWHDVNNNMDYCCNTDDCDNLAGCGSVENNRAYFYDSDNPPMNSWDFENVWREVPGDFPELR